VHLFQGAECMSDPTGKGKVTGIGGVFFLSREDDKALSIWYEKHLGISLESWGGGVLEWKYDNAEDGGSTTEQRFIHDQLSG